MALGTRDESSRARYNSTARDRRHNSDVAPDWQVLDEITVYKSLGHIVQDMASAWALYSQQE